MSKDFGHVNCVFWCEATIVCQTVRQIDCKAPIPPWSTRYYAALDRQTNKGTDMRGLVGKLHVLQFCRENKMVAPEVKYTQLFINNQVRLISDIIFFLKYT